MKFAVPKQSSQSIKIINHFKKLRDEKEFCEIPSTSAQLNQSTESIVFLGGEINHKPIGYRDFLRGLKKAAPSSSNHSAFTGLTSTPRLLNPQFDNISVTDEEEDREEEAKEEDGEEEEEGKGHDKETVEININETLNLSVCSDETLNLGESDESIKINSVSNYKKNLKKFINFNKKFLNSDIDKTRLMLKTKLKRYEKKCTKIKHSLKEIEDTIELSSKINNCLKNRYLLTNV